MDPTAGKSRASVERVPVLDGLRGLAILLVMLHHFFQNYVPEPVWIDRLVFGLMGCGWFGVDLFFVLSGFLITGILYDAKGADRYFLNFYARRTLRIFPLYYAVLVLLFVLLPRVPHPLAADYVSDSAPDQLWFWLYLTNFRIALNGGWYSHLVPSVFWSLAIEEQFYVLYPSRQ
jgi:peptidoglycan/LPS O-acetylase OafA/YrhL